MSLSHIQAIVTIIISFQESREKLRHSVSGSPTVLVTVVYIHQEEYAKVIAIYIYIVQTHQFYRFNSANISDSYPQTGPYLSTSCLSYSMAFCTN